MSTATSISPVLPRRLHNTHRACKICDLNNSGQHMRSSASSTEHIEECCPEPSYKLSLKRWWYDKWTSEALHLLLGILCITAIAILLKQYEGHTLPLNLPLGFTLGAFVSTLAAIAKYALAVPLDTSLRAQKWLWYASPETPRPLADFEKFDDASRDPVSALKLLCRLRLRSTGSIGAILVILSLAIDPFLQQIVDFAQRASLENRASVPRFVNFTRHTPMEQGGNEVIGSQPQMLEAIGKSYLTISVAANYSAFCPNTECSWPVFDTLAICSSCQDITDELKFGCREESGEWKPRKSRPNTADEEMPRTSCGWFFNISDDKPTLMSGYALEDGSLSLGPSLLMRQLNLRDPLTDHTYWNGSLRFKDVPNPLADFAVVTSPSIASIYANETPAAFECMMQWCTRTIAATFSQGVYRERVLSEYKNMTKRVEALKVERKDGFLDYLYGQSVSITPPGQTETFTVGNNSMLKTRFAFDRMIPNYLTIDNGSTATALRYNNDMSEEEGGQVSAAVNCSDWLQPEGIRRSVEEMSLAVSNAFRTSLYGEPVFGTGVFETYVQVRWVFFSLPLIVMGLTMVLLCNTVLQSQHAESGKRSSLYTLIYGLDSEGKVEFEALHSLYEIKMRAKQIAVYVDIKGIDQRVRLAPRSNAIHVT